MPPCRGIGPHSVPILSGISKAFHGGHHLLCAPPAALMDFRRSKPAASQISVPHPSPLDLVHAARLCSGPLHSLCLAGPHDLWAVSIDIMPLRVTSLSAQDPYAGLRTLKVPTAPIIHLD